ERTWAWAGMPLARISEVRTGFGLPEDRQATNGMTTAATAKGSTTNSSRRACDWERPNKEAIGAGRAARMGLERRHWLQHVSVVTGGRPSGGRRVCRSWRQVRRREGALWTVRGMGAGGFAGRGRGFGGGRRLCRSWQGVRWGPAALPVVAWGSVG